jgi:hypothetical protein
MADRLVNRAARGPRISWRRWVVAGFTCRRWPKAAQVAETFDGTDGQLLIAAAWLHDIGYAEPLVDSGFHPLDGARFLRRQGIDDRVAQLVAHHSGARVEAELRGISDYTDEFPFIGDDLDAAVTFCDLTTGPDGAELTLSERVAEINQRYGPDHVVAWAINAGVPEFERFLEATHARLAAAATVI